jgi:hypothetical protein
MMSKFGTKNKIKPNEEGLHWRRKGNEKKRWKKNQIAIKRIKIKLEMKKKRHINSN